MVSLIPSIGHIGTLVELRGTGFLGGGSSISSLRFDDDQFGTVEFGNDTYILARIPAAASPEIVDISIVSNSGALTIADDAFTYIAPGRVTDIFPPGGTLGSSVTLSGVGLRGGGSEIVAVEIGGTPVFAVWLFSFHPVSSWLLCS